MNTDNLVKVHIDLPNHWAIGGESLWATPLGNDLFRIENVPFYAYGLNFLDIVNATPVSDDLIPEIRKVVSPSGRKTYRIMFKKEVVLEKQGEILESLEVFGAMYERANSTNVSVDIVPTGDYLAVYNQLDKYELDGYLSFETCEARLEGSFDDFPEEVQNA